MNRPPPRRPASPQRPASRPSRLPPDPRLLFIGGGGVLVVIILGVLFLGPCSPLNPSDDRADALFNCPTIRPAPAPPEGLQLASQYKDFSSERCNRPVPTGPSKITMPLDEGRGGRGLALYTYTGDRWQRLAAAELTQDGKSAEVVVDRMPANGAMLRRAPDAVQIMGVVPAGQALRTDAERLVSIVGAADFTPAPDGTISGNLTNVKRGESALLAPVVRAYDPQIVTGFLQSPDRRTAHAAALARLVQSSRLDGIELDYGAVDPNFRNDFSDLARQASEQVRRAGGLLIVTAPAPTRDGSSWNTGAYDWAALGRTADYLKVVPGADQSTYRETMPAVLDYLTNQVDRKKLILSVSPLSIEKSEAGLRPISTLEALSIAGQLTVRDRDRLTAGSEITVVAENLSQEGGQSAGLAWDALTATVSFSFPSREGQRTVWIENQYSIAFKAEYVTLWNLGGISVDDASANEGLSNVWPAIDPLADRQTPPLVQPNPALLRPEWLVDNRPFQVGRGAITFRAPTDAASQGVTIVVSDGQMRVASSTRITLRPGAAATASPSPGASLRPGASPAPTPSPTPRR